MTTIASLFVFLAFYALYNTSKRVKLAGPLAVHKLLQQKPKQTKALAVGLLAIGYFVLLNHKSFECSILIFSIQIMVIGSLIVILTPLKIVKTIFLLALFILSTLVEFNS